MRLRQILLVANMLLTAIVIIGNAQTQVSENELARQTQVSQSELARQLAQGNGNERSGAVGMAHAIGADGLGPELRAALIAALEHEGSLYAQRRRGEIEFLETPELIAGLAHLVAEFREPQAIHALAGALGTSPPAIFALAEFGAPAAQPVLDIVASTEDGSIVMDALTSLRLMAEGIQDRPLSTETLDDIRHVAEQHLTGNQLVTTLWKAIDLAVVLKDPYLMRIVESIASDENAVVARGISDPDLIKQTQMLAADRLAGVLPLPRR